MKVRLWSTPWHLAQAARHSRLTHVCWGRPSRAQVAPAFRIDDATAALFEQVGPDSNQDHVGARDVRVHICVSYAVCVCVCLFV